MQTTPLSMRKHVGIFGDTNAGKSSLFNALFGQEAAIVSAQRGTTTDPIVKAMELIPYGPIALIDTGGLDDDSELGAARIKKTRAMLDRTDLAIYVADPLQFNTNAYAETVRQFNRRHIPHVLVFTKKDLLADTSGLQSSYPQALFTTVNEPASIDELKQRLVKELEQLETGSDSVIGDLLPAGSTVVMVVPVDSEAPRGRLILPQVQLIRDCLDHGMKCCVTRELELADLLSELNKVDLVVTDSQAFKIVSEIVPLNIPLTSFSMLLARQKGELSAFINGTRAVEELPEGAHILIAESCSHNHTHEDIGRVKIPAALRKHTGKELNFDYVSGHDFPDSLNKYDLVIHCGACMTNRKAVQNRLAICAEEQVPITNYGVLLAYLNGILPRCSQVFMRNTQETRSYE